MALTEEQIKQARMAALQDMAKKDVTDFDAKTEANRNPVADFGSGFNKTLISMAGFPVDAVNKAFSYVGLDSEAPVMGSEWLSNVAEDYGLINDPRLKENRAERVGGIMATAVPAIGAVGALSKAASITAPVVQGFRAAPGAWAGAETVSAAGAAAGGEIGREQGPVGEVVGAVIGGMTAPFVVSQVSKVPTIRLAKKIAEPLTESGARNVTARAIDRSIPNRQTISNLADDADLLEGAKLTVGGKSQSSQLLALEKAVAKRMPEFAEKMHKNEAETNRLVHRAFEEYGSVDNTVVFFEQQRLRLLNAFNARMSAAVSKMDDSVSKLKPNSSRAEASRIASRELEGALYDIRNQEKIVWDALPQNQMVGRTNAKTAFDDYVTKETPVPAFVRQYFKKKNKIKTFKDVKEFRTRLWKASSASARSGNADTAWVLNQINRGIIDDIKAANLGPEFDTAIKFSKNMHDMFTRGPVGRLLRYSSKGGRATPEELISDEILVASAPKAATAVRATRNAVNWYHKGKNESLEDALLDSMKNKLFKGTGEFDEAAAKSMLERKSELLDEFPALKTQITNAVTDMAERNKLQSRAANVKAGAANKNKSSLAILLGGHPDKRMDAMMGRPNRNKMLAQAVRVARKDETGAAFEGLQEGYSSWLFRKSGSGTKDVDGLEFISGRKMRDLYHSTKKDLIKSGLYSQDELKRWDKIINTAIRLEKQVLSNARDVNLTIEDAGLVEDLLLRIIGANLGATLGKGSGASFVAAGAGSRVTRQIASHMQLGKVQTLLGKMITDPELEQDLLTRAASYAQQKQVLRRVNAWIATLDPMSESESNMLDGYLEMDNEETEQDNTTTEQRSHIR